MCRGGKKKRGEEEEEEKEEEVRSSVGTPSHNKIASCVFLVTPPREEVEEVEKEEEEEEGKDVTCSSLAICPHQESPWRVMDE